MRKLKEIFWYYFLILGYISITDTKCKTILFVGWVIKEYRSLRITCICSLMGNQLDFENVKTLLYSLYIIIMIYIEIVVKNPFIDSTILIYKPRFDFRIARCTFPKIRPQNQFLMR